MIDLIEANGLCVLEVLQRGRNARTGAKESQVCLLLAERPGGSGGRPARTRPPLLDHRRLRRAVQQQFAKVAVFPQRAHSWPVGRAQALALGYPADLLATLPSQAVDAYCGVAYPLAACAPRPGDAVVEVGSGSGLDALLLAHLVGGNGRVTGVELTEEMVRRATSAARSARATNVRFQKGTVEDLPLPNSCADIFLANGVVNLLVADKPRALGEARRVLKPGGRLVLADVVVRTPAPWQERAMSEHWAAGLAGPVPEDELLDLVRAAGFGEVEVSGRGEACVGAGLAEAARTVGAARLVISCRKPPEGRGS